MKEFSKSKKPKNRKNPNPKNFAPKKTQKTQDPKNPVVPTLDGFVGIEKYYFFNPQTKIWVH